MEIMTAGRDGDNDWRERDGDNDCRERENWRKTQCHKFFSDVL